MDRISQIVQEMAKIKARHCWRRVVIQDRDIRVIYTWVSAQAEQDYKRLQEELRYLIAQDARRKIDQQRPKADQDPI